MRLYLTFVTFSSRRLEVSRVELLLQVGTFCVAIGALIAGKTTPDTLLLRLIFPTFFLLFMVLFDNSALRRLNPCQNYSLHEELLLN